MVNRIPALDALRGIAIVLVLFCHVGSPALQLYPHLSYTGVDLFFVLSGYLIGGIVLRHKNDANFVAVFYGRRLFRILPLYWLYLLLLLPALGSQLGWLLTFSANIRWSFGGYHYPWLSPIWSLCVEEQFYLVLPLLIRATPARYIPHLLAGGIILATLCRSLIAITCGQPGAAYMLFPCRMDALFLGVAVAWGIEHLRAARWLAPLTALFGIDVALLAIAGPNEGSALMMIAGYPLVDMFYAGILALLVTCCTSVRIPSFLVALGSLAYPLYLFHSPLFDLASGFFPVHGLAAATITMILSLGLSILLHRTIEAPAIEFGRRILAYRPYVTRNVLTKPCPQHA